MAIKFRLGMNVFPEAGPCIACGEDSDKFGDHAIGCGKERERIFRHNVLSDALHQTDKASLAPAKEQSALLPGSLAKTVDIYIPGGWWLGCQI